MFKSYKSIAELLKAFPDQETILNYLEHMKWNGVVVSPFDASSTVYSSGNHKYKCRNSNKYFNVLTGTIFENTKIPLQTWFLAMYLIATHKRGISSYQLAEDLSITQKTSWFLLSRIRYCMDHGTFNVKFDGTVEMDEAYVGGKNKNRHKDKKKAGGEGGADKQPVLGMLQNEVSETIYRAHKYFPDVAVKEKIVEQPAILKMEVVDNTKGETILPVIREKVEKGSTVVTDECNIYKNLNSEYGHKVVYHRLENYVTPDGYTSNRVEGAWGILKKVWGTTYAGRVTNEHLHRYCREIEYRFNTRHLEAKDKINLLLTGTNKRLRYKDLIHK